MKRIVVAILTILLLTNYTNWQSSSVAKNDRSELVLGPDKELREEYEKQQKLNKSKCSFVDPDTSVAGIKIGDVKSTLAILGKQTKLEGDSTHVFYSNDKKQKLGLTVHPGDYYSQVSIFKIAYSDNSTQNFRQINSKEFNTEKGIKLGISKKEIIKKLGTCYIAKDSTKTSIELNYRIELPNDSKTKLLTSNNMPTYYAIYRLKNDKLDYIEFGFEYP
ncbi:hypothetical protein [Xanthocytophaga flava]|uniref:hypothetical protein n=1 Tax=Xanthocytophaga flava TaxID=3048013 RepID=UPI0028D71C98|nr:hypothetical protein [Xanthocytophaga flavus]MDJ1467612.1 hypothetical protein [Xanthocytophaga flavus]